MSRCPHQSWQFLSSGFKFSPARRSCCHSQTYRDLPTPPAPKRLEADNFRTKCCPPGQKKGTRDFRACGWSRHAAPPPSGPGRQPNPPPPSPFRPPTLSMPGQLIRRSEFGTTQGPPGGGLEAAARPRVGDVELCTIDFLFSNSPPARWAHLWGENRSKTHQL